MAALCTMFITYIYKLSRKRSGIGLFTFILDLDFYITGAIILHSTCKDQCALALQRLTASMVAQTPSDCSETRSNASGVQNTGLPLTYRSILGR